MTGLEFEGKTVKDAIETACSKLNVSSRELKYDVISNGSTGIFGFVGVKKAKIRVLNALNTETASGSGRQPAEDTPSQSTGINPREAISLVDEAFKNTRENVHPKKDYDTNKRHKPFGKKRAHSTQTTDSQPAKSIEPEETIADNQRDLVDLPFSEAPSSEQRADTVTPLDTRIPEMSPSETVAADSDNAPQTEMDSAPAQNLQEVAQIGMSALQKILDHITEGVTISPEQTSDKLLFRVEGGNSSVLIGKRGQNMEAIQYIIDKIVNKNTTKHIRVQIDVAGYTEKRKENLIKMAERMAQKTKRTGKPSTVGPMNAQDRRIIHITLKNVRGVRTQSIGEGYYRKLMIFPKQAPNRKRNDSEPAEAGNESA